MTSIPFIKMHGLGNSYIYIDRFKHHLPEEMLPSLAVSVSEPGTGIGSDGLITIEPSSCATVKIRIFNKDGSEAKNCGNGLRCVAKYVFETGLSSKEMSIETKSGIVEAYVLDYSNKSAMISVNMGSPKLKRGLIPMMGSPEVFVLNEPFIIDNHHLFVTAVSMGNPHAVFFVSSINDSLHATLGPKIEKDSRFPEGVNVEFVAVESAQSLHCRVWERGSGITKACGTGACAVAVASILNHFSSKEHSILIHLEGGVLQVIWKDSGDVWMTGPAETIATGILTR